MIFLKKAKIVTTKTSRIIAWSVLRDYLYYLTDTKRIIVNNFIAGFFKGVGNAVGFLIVGAFFIYLISYLASKNLFIFGDLLDEIVNLLKYRY